MTGGWKLSIVAAALVLGSVAAAQDGPARVETDFVDRRDLTETAPVLGQVVAIRDSAVAARVSGVVAEVAVKAGDAVDAGAVLARLDTELLDIELALTEASVAEATAGREIAEAQLLNARRAFERADALRGSSAFSQGVTEDREGLLAEAIGQMAQADARIYVAEADRDRARYNRERASITAPFAGTVLEIATETGEYITTGAEIVRLLDTDSIEIEANVPADYIGALEIGVPVSGRTDSGAPFDLAVRAYLPLEFSSTRTRPVRFTADLSGTGQPVAIGQSVTVEVPVSAPRTALTVPKDALVQSADGWRVFVNEDGKAVPRDVEIGAALGERFEVVSGLAEGDEVVVRGNERLRPMQEIAPSRAGAAAPSPLQRAEAER